jgi:hypothetical protein
MDKNYYLKIVRISIPFKQPRLILEKQSKWKQKLKEVIVSSLASLEQIHQKTKAMEAHFHLCSGRTLTDSKSPLGIKTLEGHL